MTDETFNPFRYSAPVDADDLIDRDEEAETLLSLAEGEHNTRLAAPRGYGRTSLLRRVVREAEENAGLNAVLVDFWGVATRADVALRLEDGYCTLRGPVRRDAHRLLTDARLRASVGPATLELDLSARENADRLLFELLDVPRRALEKTRKRTLVVFDELQEVLRGARRSGRSGAKPHPAPLARGQLRLRRLTSPPARRAVRYPHTTAVRAGPICGPSRYPADKPTRPRGAKRSAPPTMSWPRPTLGYGRALQRPVTGEP